MPDTDVVRRNLLHEIASGASGFALALFMWGHVLLVGSILTGSRGFDWLASLLERYYIAQPTVVGVFALFVVHAFYAGRKIPMQLRERNAMRRLAAGLRRPAATIDSAPPHVESMLWIWQVRTGLVILVLGSFHIMLLGLDVLTPVFGAATGIESATTLARVRGGLWLPYGILLLAVEFHASVGLYRLAVKWGFGARLPRRILHGIERMIFWLVLIVGLLTLMVLAGLVEPPIASLLGAAA